MMSHKEIDMPSTGILYKNESMRKINTQSSFYDNDPRFANEEVLGNNKRNLKSTKIY